MDEPLFAVPAIDPAPVVVLSADTNPRSVMSESEHPQNARLEASARAICKARIHPGLSPNPMPPCQSCARLAGHALAAADGIPQDTARDALIAIRHVVNDPGEVGPGAFYQIVRHHVGVALDDDDHSCILCNSGETN